MSGWRRFSSPRSSKGGRYRFRTVSSARPTARAFRRWCAIRRGRTRERLRPARPMTPILWAVRLARMSAWSRRNFARCFARSPQGFPLHEAPILCASGKRVDRSGSDVTICYMDARPEDTAGCACVGQGRHGGGPLHPRSALREALPSAPLLGVRCETHRRNGYDLRTVSGSRDPSGTAWRVFGRDSDGDPAALGVEAFLDNLGRRILLITIMEAT